MAEPPTTATAKTKPPLNPGTSDHAQEHAAARSKVISTLALGFTNRVIAIIAVIAILAISFVSSLSVYMRQQHEIALTTQQIADRSQSVSDLQDQIARWSDPAYVEAQARDRLGWVMPGETGYRVIDKDGNVIGGLTSADAAEKEAEPGIWYETLWGSLQAADQPAPTPDPADEPSADVTIGPDTTPR